MRFGLVFDNVLWSKPLVSLKLCLVFERLILLYLFFVLSLAMQQRRIQTLITPPTAPIASVALSQSLMKVSQVALRCKLKRGLQESLSKSI